MSRIEKVNLKKKSSMAKVIGTAITVAGAMVMTLYKGPMFNLVPRHGGAHHEASVAAPENWVAGTIELIACIVGWSGFFIVQVSLVTLNSCLHDELHYNIYI